MAFNINEFKTLGLTLGGARPSLFDVQMTLPGQLAALSSTNVSISDKIRFTCRASSIPASTVGTIEIPYFGRKIKIAGDRTYDNWSVTIINDEDYSVRSAMEAWINLINTAVDNIRSNPASYKRDANIAAYAKNGSLIYNGIYTFIGLFPIEVSAMDVDWNTTDQLQEFQVTFGYDYWINSTNSTTGFTGLFGPDLSGPPPPPPYNGPALGEPPT